MDRGEANFNLWLEGFARKHNLPEEKVSELRRNTVHPSAGMPIRIMSGPVAFGGSADGSIEPQPRASIYPTYGVGHTEVQRPQNHNARGYGADNFGLALGNTLGNVHPTSYRTFPTQQLLSNQQMPIAPQYPQFVYPNQTILSQNTYPTYQQQHHMQQLAVQHHMQQLAVQHHMQQLAVQDQTARMVGIEAQQTGEEAADFEEFAATESRFHDYQPKKFLGGVPHPDPLVESSSLAAVEPPEITYKLSLPQEIFQSGLLSRAQLESVVYACQTHGTFLPLGERKGYFIGDGAGVGKGRELAAIIFENWLCGRKKHIWLSVSSDLMLDARRDLSDIGAKDVQSHALTEFDYDTIPLKRGIIFTTYTSLVASKRLKNKKSSPKTRLDQLVAWCGKDFDGCIMFDECHKAKNLGVGRRTGSKTGQAVYQLQEMLPNARIIYCSATGVTNPSDMAYMTRLGLWGPGTSFRDGFLEFLSAVERGGLGMMELVAMHLKRTGVYNCRSLSYAGTEFEIVQNDLTAAELDMYDQAAELWQLLYLELIRRQGDVDEPVSLEVEEHGATVNDDKDIKRKELQRIVVYFWGAHQRFFRSLCISLKVQQAIELAKKALREGKAPIIGLQGTGETSIMETIKTNGVNALDDFISAPKVTLMHAIRKIFGDLKEVDHRTNSTKCPSRPLLSKGRKARSDSCSSLGDFIADSDEESTADSVESEEDFSAARPLGASMATTGRLTRSTVAGTKRDSFGRVKSVYAVDDSSEEDEDFWKEPLIKSKFAKSLPRNEAESVSEKRTPKSSVKTAKMSMNQIGRMRREGWQFEGDPESDKWIQKKCRNFFDGEVCDGVIVAYLPPHANDGIPLWHMMHDDGDSEDLDEIELRRYRKFYIQKLEDPPEDEDADDGEDIDNDFDAESTQTELSSDSDFYCGDIKALPPPTEEASRKGMSSSLEARVDRSDPSDDLGHLVSEIDCETRAKMVKSSMTAGGWIFSDDIDVSPTLRDLLFGGDLSGRNFNFKRIACLPGLVNGGTTRWLVEQEDLGRTDCHDELIRMYSNRKGYCLRKRPTSVAAPVPIQNSSSLSPIGNDCRLEGEEVDRDPVLLSKRARGVVVTIDSDDSDSNDGNSQESGSRASKRRRQSPAAAPGEATVSSGDIKIEYVPSTFRESLSSDVQLGSEQIIQGTGRKLTPLVNRNRSDILKDLASCVVSDEMRHELFIELAKLINPPGNPLDTLIEHLGGVEGVAELTGRKVRLLRNKTTGKISCHKRNENGRSLDMQNVYEKQMFQKGRKKIAIISEAASAGISLQADKREKNQDRRVHITLELPWSADRAIQQLGRSHRSNQSSAPEYKILVTRFGGENRFAAAVAKKMITLGALTHGDRSSTLDSKHNSLAHFNYDSKYGKRALDEMLQKILRRQTHSLFPELDAHLELATVRLIESDTSLKQSCSTWFPQALDNQFETAVRSSQRGKLLFSEAAFVWLYLVGIRALSGITVAKFLNRILGLQYEQQNLLFQVFTDILDSIVRQAKRDGVFDMGILEVRGRRNGAVREIGPAEVVYFDQKTKDTTFLHEVEVDRAVLWDETIQILHSALLDFQEAKGPLQTDRSDPRLERHFSYSKKQKRLTYHFGYYLSKNPGMGNRHHVILVTEKISFVQDMLASTVVVIRPLTGRHEYPRFNLEEKYRRIAAEEAEKHWNSELEDDRNGLRKITYKVVSGSVLPMWPVVQDLHNNSYKNSITRLIPPVKIARVYFSSETGTAASVEGITKDEPSLIGVCIPRGETSATLTAAIGFYQQKIESQVEKMRQASESGAK